MKRCRLFVEVPLFVRCQITSVQTEYDNSTLGLAILPKRLYSEQVYLENVNRNYSKYFGIAFTHQTLVPEFITATIHFTDITPTLNFVHPLLLNLL